MFKKLTFFNFRAKIDKIKIFGAKIHRFEINYIL